VYKEIRKHKTKEENKRVMKERTREKKERKYWVVLFP
jgi:hypothetical protein